MSEQSAAIDPVDGAGGRLRLVAWLGTRVGWKRHLAALVLGALAATAMPPFFDLIGFAVALTGLVWIGDGCARSRRPGRASFWVGWFFGLGYFLVGLWWVTNALLIDAARWWWMVPVAALGLPMLLSLFWGAALWLWRRLGLTGPGRVAALAGIFGIAEWLRGTVMTGFPWNMPGYAWWPFDSVLQSASWIGFYGLTVVTLLIVMSPAAGIDGVTGRIARRAWAWPAGALGLLAAIAVGGHVRLALAPDLNAAEAHVPDVMLRLVQPNFSQTEKWTDALRNPNVATQIEMSKMEGWQQITHVIWAETAVTFSVTDKPERLAELAVAAPVGGYLLTGAPRVSVGIDSMARVHNSLLAISPTAQVAASYDKFHLVPFGEYAPFGDLLSFAGIAGGGGFTPGPGPQTLSLPSPANAPTLPPFSPLICYEAIFPGQVVATPAGPDAPAPQWLLNLTNDAWYGDSPGPRQHLQIVRGRAIEEGLPLVRAANTGISAVFDGYGREVARLDLGLRGVVDSRLPVALAGGTLYTTVGDVPFWVICAGLILVGVAKRRRRP
ncbi:MAG: apolipoprotein N-acyltransferase [Alphaproteobacteria bacterium]